MKNLLKCLCLIFSFNTMADNSGTIQNCIELLEMSSQLKHVALSCGFGSEGGEKVFSVFVNKGCNNLIPLEKAKNIVLASVAEMELRERKMGHDAYCKLASESKKQATVTEQQTQPETKTETNQSEPVIEKGKTWTGDWGNGIIATMTTEPCDIPDFTKLDYKYAMSVTIPIARLKKPADAWHIDGDRATTIMGCWFRTSGLSIHAKMIRKSNGKVTEQDFRLDDGNWSSK